MARSGFVTSAIDVTDGLAANLWQLARESRVKLVIDRAKVPVHPLVRKFASCHDLNTDEFVLFGGEDFELLFTLKPRGLARVKRALGHVRTAMTVIGKVCKGGGVCIEKDRKMLDLPDRGYEHFR